MQSSSPSSLARRRTNRLAALAATLLAVMPVTSFAVPIQWQLNGALLDGGSAGGSFVYDADFGVFSNIALTTSYLPDSIQAQYYGAGNVFTSFAGDGNYGLTFLSDAPGRFRDARALTLSSISLSLLTNAGGVLSVNDYDNIAFIAELGCDLSGVYSCAGGYGGAISNWLPGRGVSTLIGRAVAVPEPGVLSLLVAGLLGLAIVRRRNRAQR